MPRKRVTSKSPDGNHVHTGHKPTICRVDQSMKEFKLGDITWIKTRDSWWPGQVVDEGSVSFRPKKKVKDGVLVRMYGCYEFLYVDPAKYSNEFENILKQENLSTREAFQKAMDEKLSQVRSVGKSKRKVSTLRDKAKVGTRKGKNSKQEDVKQPTQTKIPATTVNHLTEEPTSNRSERCMRVMQSLGLIAPVGSPFRRNGFVVQSSLQ